MALIGPSGDSEPEQVKLATRGLLLLLRTQLDAAPARQERAMWLDGEAQVLSRLGALQHQLGHHGDAETSLRGCLANLEQLGRAESRAEAHGAALRAMPADLLRAKRRRARCRPPRRPRGSPPASAASPTSSSDCRPTRRDAPATPRASGCEQSTLGGCDVNRRSAKRYGLLLVS